MQGIKSAQGANPAPPQGSSALIAIISAVGIPPGELPLCCYSRRRPPSCRAVRQGLFNVRQLYHRAQALVTRHVKQAEAFVGASYLVGDVVCAAIPAIQSGILASPAANPDWQRFAHAYAERPNLVLAAGAFIASDYLMARKRFSTGQGVLMAGALLLTFDLGKNNEILEAATNSLTVVSAAFGAWRTPLVRRFGQATNTVVRATLGSPTRTAGIISVCADAPMVLTATGIPALARGASARPDWGLAAAALCWLAGSMTTLLLPDTPPGAVPSPQTVHIAPAGPVKRYPLGGPPPGPPSMA